MESIKSEDNNSKHLVSKLSFNEFTQRVAELIYNESIKLKIYYSEKSPKVIHGVGFWLEDSDNGLMLKYNVPPKMWDVNNIIHSFELDEQLFFERSIVDNRKSIYG